MENLQFGKIRRKDLVLDSQYICINAGSFGVVPKQVLEVKAKFQQKMNSNPQKYFRIQSQDQIQSIRKIVALKVNCNYKNLFLVQNATQAFNCLAKSLNWTKQDTVIIPNTAYSAIKNTILYLQSKFGFTILNVDFKSQDFTSEQKILRKIKQTADSYDKKISLAVFDHIISKPGIICPINQIIKYFKQKKIPVFVDGAHALGHTKIDIQKLNPDAYFSNCHKWSFCPKSAAFLYISDPFLSKIQPATTGNYYGQSIDRQFLWTGTKDISSYMCISAGFDYAQKLGVQNIYQHNHNLAMKTGNKIAQIWGTKALTEDQQMIGYMRDIQLPKKYHTDMLKCLRLPFYMIQKQNCYPVIFTFDGKAYLRISCHIYNQLQEYQWAAKKIIQILESKQYDEWYKNQIQKDKGKKLLY